MKLVHVRDDIFDLSDGKRLLHAVIRIGEEGEYEVIGPPAGLSASAAPEVMEEISGLLAGLDAEYLAVVAMGAREWRGGVEF